MSCPVCFCCVLCQVPVKLMCFLSCDVQRSSEANVFLSCAVQRSEGDDQEREKQRRELEAANDILHKEIEKLEQALKYTEGLVSELAGSLADW